MKEVLIQSSLLKVFTHNIALSYYVQDLINPFAEKIRQGVGMVELLACATARIPVQLHIANQGQSTRPTCHAGFKLGSPLIQQHKESARAS